MITKCDVIKVISGKYARKTYSKRTQGYVFFMSNKINQ